ncbi:peptidoglycan editing factor PgeF [Tissierella pigra]|uniref:Purine nucleoside phosphorylase n=1 Tax=Tissierella pigra TaxID=2607614 RepID=A0A6N7XI68_9FIRM|nr:peptidoglycan editing factor PgeF [Tissierella pigra]MBU5426780.1 peptidoglycan editing factor PgeF [Tissierella pigra]MSU01346.1 peptidoglycan editing factor PgeF [Tissierella pigra]
MGAIKKYKDNILYYEINGFNEDKKMKHIFSTRIGWEQDKIFHNLSYVLDIPEEKIYRAKQVHGTDILIIKNQDNRDIEMEKVDGLITGEKGIALCTYHADCVPIYFYDNVKEIIGIAHAGWKGTLNNINKVMIENMNNEFNSSIKDIKVAIGPSISILCYEIGSDVENLFKNKYPNYLDIIIKKDNNIYLDLWKVNKLNLLSLGIKEENIFESNLCTGCNLDTLYSYRKENGTKNRMIAAITLN